MSEKLTFLSERKLDVQPPSERKVINISNSVHMRNRDRNSSAIDGLHIVS